ncbi:MAG: M28 family peptidase [Candidatus Lokiarchaeota archaeon]|nr:M28 family peptidase [Candidatus Lokiarchaeota archaeon]
MLDENRIKENLETFSFPRLSGTEGERKALKLALKRVEDLNLKPMIQDFMFSTFFGRIYPKVAFLLGFVILFLFYLNFTTIIIPLLLMISSVILVILFFLATKPESMRLPKLLNSSNLYVKVVSNPKKSQLDPTFKETTTVEKNILFMCHLDSKGQRFSILYRVRIIRTWVFSGVIILIVVLIKNYILTLFSLFFYIIGIIPLAVNLIAAILFLLNTTNDSSKGAIDNASGIACVFELLSYFSNPDSRLKHFNLWFVFTGAEECGTMGIRNFYQKIKHLNKEESIIFNFDSIAESSYFFPDNNTSDQVQSIFSMFVKNNKSLVIKSNPKKIPFGSHTDGYYLKKKNFHGIGFGDLECYEHIHSVHDTVDKVDISLLRRLCETIIDNLIVFDDQIKSKD